MICLKDSLGTSKDGRSCGSWGKQHTRSLALREQIYSGCNYRRAGHGEIIGAGLGNLMEAASSLCRGLR
jgi:hypothetical protein